MSRRRMVLTNADEVIEHDENPYCDVFGCTPVEKEKEKDAIWLYLAGKMRGEPLYGFPVFDSAAAWLREDGYKVISPAELDRAVGFDPAVSMELPEGFVEGAMRRDLDALLKVDGVALLPGWESSAGVKVELGVARALGLPVWELKRNWVPASYDRCIWTTGWTHLEPLPEECEETTCVVANPRTVGKSTEGREAWWTLKPSATEWSEVEVDEDPELTRLFAEEAEVEARYTRAVQDKESAPGWDDLTDEQRWSLGSVYRVATAALSDRDRVPYDDAVAVVRPSYMNGGEVRVTAATGGQKCQKPQQVHQIPPDFLLGLGEVYATAQSTKYPDVAPGRPNWSKGYAWSLSYSALQRHLGAFWKGEYLDPDDGLPHLLHAAWHCATLFTWHEEGIAPECDDRPAYLAAKYVDQDELDRIAATKETV